MRESEGSGRSSADVMIRRDALAGRRGRHSRDLQRPCAGRERDSDAASDTPLQRRTRREFRMKPLYAFRVMLVTMLAALPLTAAPETAPPETATAPAKPAPEQI